MQCPIRYTTLREVQSVETRSKSGFYSIVYQADDAVRRHMVAGITSKDIKCD